MKAASALIILGALATFHVSAEPLGEHPAVLQKRAAASAGYDYASKFYPHPAWMYLRGSQDGDGKVEPAGTVGAPALVSAPLAPPPSLAVARLATDAADRPAIFYRPLRRRSSDR